MPDYDGGNMPDYDGGNMPDYDGGNMPDYDGGNMSDHDGQLYQNHGIMGVGNITRINGIAYYFQVFCINYTDVGIM